MMDAYTAPRIPTTDTAASHATSGGRADKSGEGGFSEALSSSGRQGQGDTKDSEVQADEGSGNEHGDVAAPETGRSKRPIIDLSQASLLKPVSAEATSAAAEQLDPETVAVDGKDKTKVKAHVETDGKASSLDEQQLAALVKSGGLKAAASDGAKTTEADSDVSATEDGVSADGKSADLGDVLSLLTTGAGTEQANGQSIAHNAVEGSKTIIDGHGEQMVEALTANGVSAGDGETVGADGSESDQSFRFVRADGKGQSVTLRSEAAQTLRDDGEPASSTVETVTVIDARRFLAPVSSNNAASITAAMVGDSEWISAMSPGSELANAATQSSQGKVVNTLKIQMNPIELGSVTATLKLTGEELSIQLTVENHAALQKLTKDQDEILKALRAQGLTVDQVQVNIQVAPADRSADSQSSGNGQQNGQATGQQASDQSGRQAGGDRQTRGDAASDRVRTTDDRTLQPAGNQGVADDSTRPDLIYI
ncbi:flagellar hook-length control protein FliK [Rhizobium sp. 18065]|uniref:flagellar hook-length control protein FliK n=1 Tax=Rhizobium sp. 18065 TaxID=2681411 RepID=UPI0013588BA7|nr:flagellar hook-length control protein FliK [Rhizobium sp. 18065]